MERKSDIVRRFVAQGDYRKALSIAKGFRLGITPEQRSTMTRAYECMVHPDFYISLGTNLPQAIDEGVSVLTKLYG